MKLYGGKQEPTVDIPSPHHQDSAVGPSVSWQQLVSARGPSGAMDGTDYHVREASNKVDRP